VRLARRVEKVSRLDNFPLPERQPGIVFFRPCALGSFSESLTLLSGVQQQKSRIKSATFLQSQGELDKAKADFVKANELESITQRKNHRNCFDASGRK
jgi:hypothetical protein